MSALRGVRTHTLTEETSLVQGVLVVCLIAALGLLAGCGGGPSAAPAPQPIGVSLSPSTAQGIDQSQMKSVTAMVSNDSSNKGVTWVVSTTQGGASCAPGCGSISPTTSTTAPFTTTYTPPSTSTPTVFVTATSAADTTKSASVMITVNKPPTGPSGTTAAPTATVGMPYMFNLTTLLSGGTPPFTWAITSGTLPPGLTLNSSTGVISGTPFGTKPSGLTVRSHSAAASDPTVTFTATDSSTGTPPPPPATVTLSFTVNPPPPLTITTPSPLPNATAGSTYSATLQATGGFGTLTWSLATGSSLPAGFTLSPAGVISGKTNNVGGPFTFGITVTDSESTPMTATATFTLTVSQAATLSITTTSLPTGTVGVAYPSTTVQATGGVAPLKWSTGMPPLPPGLTLDMNTGVISGTPTMAVTNAAVTIMATDAEVPPQTATGMLTITINPAGTLTITTVSLPNGTVNTAYNQTVSATGGTPPYTFSVTAGSLPTGLNLTTANNQGVISGTPTTAGTFSFTVQVTDSEAPAKTAGKLFSLTINAAAACTVGPTTLCGQFAFLIQGFDSSGVVAIAGSFTADGNGHVTGGAIDINRVTGGQPNVAITSGSFVVNLDHRGALALVTGQGTTAQTTVFRFALNSSGTFADIIEFDDSTGTGTRGSGFFQLQDSTAFNAAAIAGNYALGLIGAERDGTRVGMLAAFSIQVVNGVCQFATNGNTVTINVAGTVSTASLIAPGGCANFESDGRVSASFTLSPNPFPTTPTPIVGNLYIIDATKLIFFRRTGTGLMPTGDPLLSGVVLKQVKTTAFSSSDVACGVAGSTLDTGCVFGASGRSGAGANVVVGRVVQPSVGSLTIQRDRNKAGTVTNTTEMGFTFSVQSAGNGKVTPPAGSMESVTDFVLTDTDKGILLEENGAVSFGFVRPQTATAFTSSPGTFILGTQFVANPGVPNVSGILTPSTPVSGAGTFTATLDVSENFCILIPSIPCLLPDVAIPMPGGMATYTLNLTTGRGVGTVVAPPPAPPGLLSSFVFDVVGPGEIVLIETDPATINPNPVFIDLSM